jgi:hypothetical protein
VVGVATLTGWMGGVQVAGGVVKVPLPVVVVVVPPVPVVLVVVLPPPEAVVLPAVPLVPPLPVAGEAPPLPVAAVVPVASWLPLEPQAAARRMERAARGAGERGAQRRIGAWYARVGASDLQV